MPGWLHVQRLARARVLAASALVCAACTCATCAPPPAPRERLVLALAMLPHAGLVHLALARGEFARQGLDVTVERHAFGKPALDALLSGRADVATAAETPVVLAALAGRRLAVVAAISSASENTVVVARRRAVAAPRDLAGKRVGVARGTNGEFFLETLLVRHRVDSRTVARVDLAPAEMAPALAQGRVDAVAVWSPVSDDLCHRFGDAVVVFAAPDVYRETFEIAVRPDLSRERPGAVERFLRALLAAEAFQRDQPAEARRLTAGALAPTGVGAEALDRFEARVWLDQGLLTLMEQEARWAIRCGLVADRAVPNFLETVQLEPLLAVKPDAVRVLR